MLYDVVFAPEAKDDLIQLYIYIAEQSGSDRAMAYVGRIEEFCRGFTTGGQSGTISFLGCVSLALSVASRSPFILTRKL